MGEIAARGGNSAAGLEKLVAGEALESDFCCGEHIRIAFMDEGRKQVIALVAGMASLPPPACSTRKKLAARETAFRESIDLAEERIDRRWPRAREWLPLHL